MLEISNNELKSIELDLLTKVTEICSGNGFRYSLAGGSLLGAIRHNGFIPWDDDIDIMMPRSDYDAFIEYCSKNDVPFFVLNCKTNDAYGMLHTKVCAPDTELVEEAGYRTEYKEGVFIDIFPVDGMGATREEALERFRKLRFGMELLNAANWKRFTRSRTRGFAYEPIRFAFYLLSRFTTPNKLAKKIEKKIKGCDIDTAQFAGCYCGSYREREIMSADTFINYTEHEFENANYRIFKDYDRYLSSLYGDYMTLPPVEKRVSHHGFTAYFKTERNVK